MHTNFTKSKPNISNLLLFWLPPNFMLYAFVRPCTCVHWALCRTNESLVQIINHAQHHTRRFALESHPIGNAFGVQEQHSRWPKNWQKAGKGEGERAYLPLDELVTPLIGTMKLLVYHSLLTSNSPTTDTRNELIESTATECTTLWH